MISSKHIFFLLTACAVAPSAFAMEGINVDFSLDQTAAEVVTTALSCIEELKIENDYGVYKEVPNNGIIVIRTPEAFSANNNFGHALQRQLCHHLESLRQDQIEMAEAGTELPSSIFHPWQESFFEKLNLKSLQRCPDKSIIYGALPKGAKHLPLITAKKFLANKKCWLVVQELDGSNKKASSLFASREDTSFITAEITYPK